MRQRPDIEGPPRFAFPRRTLRRRFPKHLPDEVSGSHDPRPFDELLKSSIVYPEVVSNEFSLYELFPYLGNPDGVLVGVGFDTILDLFVNSQATDAFIVDKSAMVSPASRALLEAGRRLKLILGRPVEPAELVTCFSETHLPQTLALVNSEFNDDENSQLENAFR